MFIFSSQYEVALKAWTYLKKQIITADNWLNLCLVAQLCPTLCHPMDCSPPGFSVHGILQARILEWVAIPFSRGSSWSKDWTLVSSIAGEFFIVWVSRKAQTLVYVLSKGELFTVFSLNTGIRQFYSFN